MRYCVDPECIARENSDQTNCSACRTPLVIQGRYRVIRPLRQDRTALAEVFLVEDTQEGKSKVLKTLISPNPKAQQLFEQEQTLLKKLRHPGIPKGEAHFSLELPSGKTLPCLVMEYIEGIDLEHWLQDYGAIDQQQAIPWLRQLTDILDFIHQRNFFHRDIKPSNVMRRHTGQLALIDFGTAREISQPQAPGGTATIVGTYGYAPPEQWAGDAVLQSDFYALGMTLIRLLTGAHPDQQQLHPQAWRRQTIHAIDPGFADLIDHLIDPNPQNRPANATLLLQAIDALNQPSTPPIAQLAAPSTEPASTEPVLTEPGPDRNRKRIPLLLSLVALLGLAGAAWQWDAISRLWQPEVCDLTVGDQLSCGEEALVPQLSKQSAPVEKQQGIEALKQQDYGRAYQLLDIAWGKQRDPETLIYRNNAKIRVLGAKDQPIYTIAAAIPLNTPDKDSDTGIEMLRGVAQAQDQAIQQGMNLQVLIADDGNQKAQGQAVASALVNKPKLLAVIGHYASEVTIPAVPIYQQHQLVVISPTSTSTDLSKAGKQPDHVFFRTGNTTRQHAEDLVRYLDKQAPGQKVAIFYNQGENNAYSKSIRDQFVELLSDSSLVKGAEFDLSEPQFDASEAIAEVKAAGATAIAVFPDGHTNPFTFQNALDLIKENRGELWVLASNTLYESDLLRRVGSQSTSRMVVSVFWHFLNSPDRNFPKAAQDEWGGPVSGKTASAYDAGEVLVTALQQNPKSRRALRQILADPNFSAKGATGEISFNGGDRREQTTVLVKVVPSCSVKPDQDLKYHFVPIEYAKACY